jgi:hypothetical protein
MSWDVAGAPLCNRGSVNGQDPLLYVEEALANGDGLHILLPLMATAISPGGSASMSALIAAAPANVASLTLTQAGSSCAAWTGTVYFDSDMPAWKVRLDLTCAEAGKGNITLAGTFSGTL